jgi:hypothetical protein
MTNPGLSRPRGRGLDKLDQPSGVATQATASAFALARSTKSSVLKR